MKKILIVLSFVLFAVSVNAQTSTLTAYTAKAFAKATSRVDTSATLSIGAYPYVMLQTTSTGSDSAVIVSSVDAYINGVWVNTITTSTLTLGRPTSHILATSKGQVNYLLLRAPATELLGGANTIRIRNTLSAGAGDSTSATTYTQKILMRKP